MSRKAAGANGGDRKEAHANQSSKGKMLCKFASPGRRVRTPLRRSNIHEVGLMGRKLKGAVQAKGAFVVLVGWLIECF